LHWLWERLPAAIILFRGWKPLPPNILPIQISAFLLPHSTFRIPHSAFSLHNKPPLTIHVLRVRVRRCKQALNLNLGVYLPGKANKLPGASIFSKIDRSMNDSFQIQSKPYITAVIIEQVIQKSSPWTESFFQ